MGRIILLAPFGKTEISGGIKTVYRHAELLTADGLRCLRLSARGAAGLVRDQAKVLPKTDVRSANDILVFPETLHGPLEIWAKRARSKVVFCQAQYYMALNPIPAERLGEFGFAASPAGA